MLLPKILPLFALTFVIVAACADDPSPVQKCEDEALRECCIDSDCDQGICDFDYICSPGPDDSLECSEGSGDQLCHVLCKAEQANQPCADGAGTCTKIERFQGGDHGVDAFACF